jgi:hypothetical protein
VEINNTKIIVYVGDITQYLADIALLTDPSATLINANNCHNLVSGTYYTSIGDLNGLQNFSAVIQQATDIVYAPPVQWSDSHKGHSNMQHWTENYLMVVSNKKSVTGIMFSDPDDKNTMLAVHDTRKGNDRQLWVSGCSVTFGVGVDLDKRYGQLLANQMKLPVSFLARPGSSLTWAADQILRSDIRAGDVVVWGLTAHERFPYFKNNKITHVNANTYVLDPKFAHKVNISFLDSQQLIYQAVTVIHQVINFCQKVEANLVVAQLLGDKLFTYLQSYSNYLMLHHQFGRNHEDKFLDLGTDDIHPGPVTHQWYYEQILSKYQTIYKENK